MQGQRLEPPDNQLSLIISFLLDPSSGVTSQKELSALIVNEDDEGEGESWEPPVELQRVHSQSLVHARGVGQESGQKGFEDKTKVHEPVLHSLLEHRVLPGLTDDEISPLYNDDGHEEGSMASVLKDLSILVGPLLTIGILQIVDCNGVPCSSESQKMARPETILAKDDKVDKESGGSLDHTNLTVGHGD